MDEEGVMTETKARPYWYPVAAVAAVMALALLALWLIPGLAAESERKDRVETQRCEMAHVRDGASLSVAELMCSRAGWQR
jgi:hypothetical protein